MKENPETPKFRVAVIGGGMAGATAAYYLRELFASRVGITLFEQSGRIGGRMKIVEFADRKKETGASIFHSCNHYMYNFAKQFGLEIKEESKSDDRLLFYAGQGKLSYSTLGGPSWLVPLRLVWRYGLSLIKAKWFTDSLMRNFVKIYSLQDCGYCFSTTARLFETLKPEFVEMTKWRYGDWLSQKVRVNDTFKDEIAYGLVSNNYCQNLDVHAFVGFISMATILPKLYSIKGGNEQVPQKLVENALKESSPDNPSQLLYAQVTSISSTEKNKWTVEYRTKDNETVERDTFDYIILAAPLHQKANIKTDSSVELTSVTYQRVDNSLFCGSLKSAKFGIAPNSFTDHQTAAILPNQTCYLKGSSAFRSLISFTVDKNQNRRDRIWSAFSDPERTSNPINSIGNEYLELIEDKTTVPVTVQWLAYPSYSPMNNPHIDLGSFVLAPKFYYANAIEQMASCMETAAIGGRNAALLVAADRDAVELQKGKQIRKPLAQLDQKIG